MLGHAGHCGAPATASPAQTLHCCLPCHPLSCYFTPNSIQSPSNTIPQHAAPLETPSPPLPHSHPHRHLRRTAPTPLCDRSQLACKPTTNHATYHTTADSSPGEQVPIEFRRLVPPTFLLCSPVYICVLPARHIRLLLLLPEDLRPRLRDGGLRFPRRSVHARSRDSRVLLPPRSRRHRHRNLRPRPLHRRIRPHRGADVES